MCSKVDEAVQSSELTTRAPTGRCTALVALARLSLGGRRNDRGFEVDHNVGISLPRLETANILLRESYGPPNPIRAVRTRLIFL